MKFKNVLLISFACVIFAGCGSTEGQETKSQPAETPKTVEKVNEKPGVIEVTTFKYKSTVDGDAFWKRDAEVQADYTSKQSGFISRHSGVSEDGEVAVVVYWKSESDAEASMKKFMADKSVADYAEMIDGSTMKMKRYSTK